MPGWLMLVAAMTAVGPVSIDMYLPGFRAIEREFGQRGVEGTMAAYLLGVAFGQLFYGPLSDRFGRKAAAVRWLHSLLDRRARLRAREQHVDAHARTRRAGAGRLRRHGHRPGDRARSLGAQRGGARLLHACNDRCARPLGGASGRRNGRHGVRLARDIRVSGCAGHRAPDRHALGAEGTSRSRRGVAAQRRQRRCAAMAGCCAIACSWGTR